MTRVKEFAPVVGKGGREYERTVLLYEAAMNFLKKEYFVGGWPAHVRAASMTDTSPPQTGAAWSY